jgi:flagellar capping protein FliD
MSDLAMSGVNTGIDTDAIIKQLVNIKSRAKARYQVQKNETENISKLFDELSSKVSSLRSATKAISDTDSLKSFNTSVSDQDKLSISTSSDTAAGSHSVQINQLATTETWIQDSTSFNYTTDYVGGGNFIYTYNNQQRVIQTVEDDTTVQDLVNLINNDENNPGVTASLLKQGDSYHLMLSGQNSGTDYQISIDNSSREVLAFASALTKDEGSVSADDKIIGVDQFSGTLEGDESITISGTTHNGTSVNHTFNINDQTTIKHLIDEINQAFDGSAEAIIKNGKIQLVDNTTGSSQMDISITYNQGSGDTTLDVPEIQQLTEGGAETANLASLGSDVFTETQSAQDSKIRIDGYPSAVSEVQTLTADNPATSGTFTLTFNGQETAPISYDASTSEIQTALEQLSNIEQGDIVVSGDSLDTDPVGGGLVFTFSDEKGDVDMLEFDFSNLTGASDAGSEITETVKGEDNWITNSSNTITDVVSGVTLNLKETTDAGSPVNMSITKNNSAVTSKINSIVSAYNELVSFVESYTGYNAETKEMGALSSEVAVSFIKTQIRNPFIQTASGFNSGKDSFTTAKDIGITVGGDGKLEVDNSALDQAISDDYNGVASLLGASETGYCDNDFVDFYSSSEYTEPGEYTVKIECDNEGNITDAWIKQADQADSEYRQMSWTSETLSATTDFSSELPEKGLKLTFECSDGVAHGEGETEPAIITNVRVKQGIGGNLKTMLDEILDTDGRVQTGKDSVEDKIENLEDKITREQERLEKYEQRLVEKYARMEVQMTKLQQQQSAVSMLNSQLLG